MGSSNAKGVRRLINACFYTMAGFKATWKSEEAFRQEVVLSVIMIPAGLWIGTTATHRALLVGTCMIVLITELLNSAIETVVDRIGSENHVLSGQAKDMGSAAVFVSLCTTVLVWGLIIYERFFAQPM